VVDCPHEAKVGSQNDEEEDDKGDGNWRIKSEEHDEEVSKLPEPHDCKLTTNATKRSEILSPTKFIIDKFNGTRAPFSL